MSTLTEFEQWYTVQCDGEWEHTYGIRIETLDNPGWMVDVDLWDTVLEAQPFTEISIDRSEKNWLRCWKADGVFHGRGGVQNLAELLTIFVAWSNSEHAGSV